MLVKQGEVVVAAGALAGLVIFLMLAKLLDSVAFEVHTVDVASVAGAFALVLVIASLATWLPARRAARIDPA